MTKSLGWFRKCQRLVLTLAALFVPTAVVSTVALNSAGASTPVSATPPVYVSLGDSYTSGPFIPNQLPDPPGCLRSDHNYPHFTASALRLTLTDVSCSGATTTDMSQPQSTEVGTNPPQFNALSTSTSVVSVGIGGNDIGFVNIIENCGAATPDGPTMVGPNCKSYYDPNGDDHLAASIAALAPKIGTMLQTIHAKSRHAKVFVVGYPAILPPTGTGCWPQMPLTTTDVPYLRQTEIELDQMLASEAAAHRATYVDTYTPSQLHNACTSEFVRWVEPVVPNAPAAPVHPNAAGEAAMAGMVQSAMKAQGIK